MTQRNKYPNIAAECSRADMSMNDLAVKLNVSRKTVTNWQAGKTEIPASAIVTMAKMWNVSSDYLLGIQH